MKARSQATKNQPDVFSCLLALRHVTTAEGETLVGKRCVGKSLGAA